MNISSDFLFVPLLVYSSLFAAANVDHWTI